VLKRRGSNLPPGPPPRRPPYRRSVVLSMSSRDIDMIRDRHAYQGHHTGQVSIPAPIRRQLRITADTTVEWIVEGSTVRVIPLPDDPLAAFRGSGRGGR
jgi:hypothetical protein